MQNISELQTGDRVAFEVIGPDGAEVTRYATVIAIYGSGFAIMQPDDGNSSGGPMMNLRKVDAVQ